MNSRSGCPHGEPTALDRVLRETVRRVTQLGPPPPHHLLSPLRIESAAHACAAHRRSADAIGERLRDGAPDARAALAALAERALADMRADFRGRADRAGAIQRLLARSDARWGECDTDELLDDPALSERVRTAIMATLDTFNDEFATYESFLDEVLPLVQTRATTRVLDLAAGHGGFVLAAARSARRRGLDIRFTASDAKREYLDMGEAVARREELPVEFAVQDAFDLSNLGDGAFDLIVCTQSLHHFPAGWVAVMFEAATRAAARGVVFIDGCRSAFAGLSAVVYGTLRARNPAWIHDAWISTRKCFVPEELELLARIGSWGDGVEARWIPPGHCLLRWRRTH